MVDIINAEYKAPVSIFEMGSTIVKENAKDKLGEKLYAEIISQYGVYVDKEELAKALKYDRNQYNTGYNNAIVKAIKEINAQYASNSISIEAAKDMIEHLREEIKIEHLREEIK